MRTQVKNALLLVLMTAGALRAAAAPAVVFSPPSGRFGMIVRGQTIEIKVTAANSGAQAVAVRLVPTCTCLTVEPERRTIAAESSESFLLKYDSSDDTGITRKDFIVVTEPPGLTGPYYSIFGTVRAQAGSGAAVGAAAGPAAAALSPAPAALAVLYYYTPGCRSCEEFLSTEIPRLEKTLGVKFALEKRDLLQPPAYEELAGVAASFGGIRAIPALRAGGVLLQGDAEIRARLPEVLRAQAAQLPVPSSAAGAPASGLAPGLSVLPIVAAGLIDGVNPCAFTTLIFLLASLALAGRGRHEVLLIGAVFSLAVFLSYLGIGYGLFAVLRAASSVAVISLALRWVLVAVLAVFAGMSIYDYTLIRRGRPSEILLQLPSALKRQIHNSIRARVKTAAIAGSSLVLGFLVSVFEFACTGQVYLPLLAYMARMRRGLAATGLLLLYNLCFIAPLLVVFGASYLGVSSGRITTFFQAHMGKVKLGLAAVFAGLAVFTLVG